MEKRHVMILVFHNAKKPPEATLRGWKREVVDGEGYSAGA